MGKFNMAGLSSLGKDVCIDAIIKSVYEGNRKLPLTTRERKRVESLYKKSYKRCRTLSDLVRNNLFLQDVVNRVPSIRNYLAGQIEAQRALQPGYLSECCFVYSLSRILGCTGFYDVKDPCNMAPASILKRWNMVRLKYDSHCAARYFYYDKNNPDKMVVQYGNPENKDASVILFMHEIVLEIKDVPAVHKTVDLYYDDNGKLILTDMIRSTYPAYEKCINDFNAMTSVYDFIGHNFKIDMSTSNVSSFTNQYIGFLDFDLLLTSKNDELVVLKVSDLGAEIDGKRVVVTKDSEIRITGRNGGSVFQPDKLDEVLANIGAHEHCGRIFVSKKNIIGPVRGRGKSEVTRVKLVPIFWLKAEDAQDDAEYYSFKKKDVIQARCCISMHIDIAFSAQAIYENLYKGRI